MSIIDWGTSQATMLPYIYIYTVNVNVHLQSLKQKSFTVIKLFGK